MDACRERLRPKARLCPGSRGRTDGQGREGESPGLVTAWAWGKHPREGASQARVAGRGAGRARARPLFGPPGRPCPPPSLSPTFRVLTVHPAWGLGLGSNLPGAQAICLHPRRHGTICCRGCPQRHQLGPPRQRLAAVQLPPPASTLACHQHPDPEGRGLQQSQTQLKTGLWETWEGERYPGEAAGRDLPRG